MGLQDDAPLDRLADLARQLASAADAVRAEIEVQAEQREPTSLAEAVVRARAELRSHAIARAQFPKVAGNIGWSMLLAMFIADAEAQPCSIASLTKAVGASPTTGNSWALRLIDQGLVIRSVDRSDAKRASLTLSASARSKLVSYFAKSAR